MATVIPTQYTPPTEEQWKLANSAAESFSRLFYDALKNNRDRMDTFYMDEARLVWNGNACAGKSEVLQLLNSLPSLEVNYNSISSQPLQTGLFNGQQAIMVTVFGTIKLAGTNHLQLFNENFVLVQDAGGLWRVFTDVFRTMSEEGPMSNIYQTLTKYIEVCANRNEPVHEFVLAMLNREKEESLVEERPDCFLKLCGNNHLFTQRRLVDADMPALCETLKSNTFVTGLDLRYNRLTDAGAKILADMLKTNRSITELNLLGNDITHAGGIALAEMLEENTTLLILKLHANRVRDKAVLRLAHALQVNRTLQYLDVGETDTEIDSVIALATVLNYNTSLLGLNVDRPLLWTHQEETTVHMSDMLKRNRTLEELHLQHYDMRDFGVERIVEGLWKNPTLRILDLSCNRMTRDGARALAKLLRENTPLEVLDVSFNRIQDDGASAIADALTTSNTHLRVLGVSHNELNDRGLVALASSLTYNLTLTTLYIWGNKHGEPACDAYHQLLESGRLKEENTDVRSYQVDGHNCLARLSHDAEYRKFRFAVPIYGPDVPKDKSYALF